MIREVNNKVSADTSNAICQSVMSAVFDVRQMCAESDVIDMSTVLGVVNVVE
jgi:hypothetical protein